MQYITYFKRGNWVHLNDVLNKAIILPWAPNSYSGFEVT